MILADIIKKEAYNSGIHLTGITTADDLSEETLRIQYCLKEDLIPVRTGLNEKKIKKFCSPSIFMPGAKSIIMTALCYYEEEKEILYDEPVGEIAPYTWRNNYKFLRKKLQKLVKFIKTYSSGNFKVFVNGPLAEKPLAVRAGIGFYGKNGIIYTHNYGSKVVLGGIITDIELPPDKSEKTDKCNTCNLCMRHCPTGAIIKPYIINRKKCIQYLSQTIHEVIPENYRKLWENRLYGCSTCQDICPQNKKVIPLRDLSPYGITGSTIPVIPLLKLTEKEFREKYRDNQISASWVDFNAIRRNALLALANSGDNRALPVLRKALNDTCLQVREIVEWGLRHKR
ncbi:MAG TPA: tRNA epoxyqueuosine(34) reductase QueG [Candidatus Eremiobacteraeota bacterium]|nr:MAG: Epoxyqueuosine reductase [bacterium ADurb.Bin363]HPZ10292.1 tRNA epoxyqueuosine(34) reductase QueG [Candidatus Eremiobacteraeota bacterium]